MKTNRTQKPRRKVMVSSVLLVVVMLLALLPGTAFSASEAADETIADSTFSGGATEETTGVDEKDDEAGEAISGPTEEEPEAAEDAQELEDAAGKENENVDEDKALPAEEEIEAEPAAVPVAEEAEEQGGDETVNEREEKAGPETTVAAQSFLFVPMGGSMPERPSIVTITDEAGLRQALADGATSITISGAIELASTIEITYGTTISGGTLYSSVVSDPKAQIMNMLTVNATGETVTLHGITLDGKGCVAGIAAVAGSLTVQDSTFRNLVADNGAAIYSNGEQLQVLGSVFSNCSAYNNGGAIFAAGPVTMDKLTFVQCHAGGQGGAIFVLTNSYDLSLNLWFYDCTAGAGGSMIGGGPRNIGAPYTNENSTIEVAFDANGGEPAYFTQTAQYHGLLAEPTNVTRTGHELTGWYNGETKWNFASNSIATEGIVLTAQWVVLSYELTWDFGGAATNRTVNVPYGEIIAEYSPTPEYTGHTFAGWYTSASGGDLWDFGEGTMPAENITLYARWTENEPDDEEDDDSSTTTDTGSSEAPVSSDSSNSSSGREPSSSSSRETTSPPSSSEVSTPSNESTSVANVSSSESKATSAGSTSIGGTSSTASGTSTGSTDGGGRPSTDATSATTSDAVIIPVVTSSAVSSTSSSSTSSSSTSSSSTSSSSASNSDGFAASPEIESDTEEPAIVPESNEPTSGGSATGYTLNDDGSLTYTTPDGTEITLAEGAYSILDNGRVLDHNPESPYFIEDNGTVNIGPAEVPLGGLNSIGGWGLVNLILALLAIVSMAAQLARNVVQKRLADMVKLCAALSGLLPILFFGLLENKTQMILFTKWTPVIVAFFIVHVGMFVFSNVYKKNETALANAE